MAGTPNRGIDHVVHCVRNLEAARRTFTRLGFTLTPGGAGALTVPRGDEIPVFWACGQTTHLAIATAQPPLAITHSKAHMVLTDRLSEEFLES